MWLELGISGLLIFAASFIFTFAQAIVCVRETKLMYGLFPIIFLTFHFLSNITESTFIGDNIFWALYVSTFFLNRENRNYSSINTTAS
jgi:O-antigen ligase